jgi:hypothetical protein
MAVGLESKKPVFNGTFLDKSVLPSPKADPIGWIGLDLVGSNWNEGPGLEARDGEFWHEPGIGDPHFRRFDRFDGICGISGFNHLKFNDLSGFLTVLTRV